MNKSKISEETKICEAIAIIKLMILCYCILELYRLINDNLIHNFKIHDKISNSYSLVAIVLVLFSIVVYSLWIKKCKKDVRKKNSILKIKVKENILYIIIFGIIISSCSPKAEYIYLLLLLIITTTIELGKKKGIIMAILSYIVIIVSDLIKFSYIDFMKFRLQSDLIMFAIFILSSWFLGYYVDNEKKRFTKKNDKITKVGIELKENKKNTEKKLLEIKQCYDKLIEDSKDTIILHRGNDIIYANKSTAKLLNLKTVDEIIGKSILDIIPYKEKQIVSEKYKNMYIEKTPMNFEAMILKSNDDIIPVRNTSICFLYENESTVLSIITDITQEKEMKLLKEDNEINANLLKESLDSNKLIIEFFSNISHELKTPLTVIYSCVQVLGLYLNVDKELGRKQEKYLKLIKQNCNRLTRLVNNLLDLTKMDAGFLTANFRRYNLVSVVEQITLSVVEFAKTKGINIIFDTDEEEIIMNFDIDKMERIMLNLLSNAIKFTNNDGVILVSVVDGIEYAEISVKDDGDGIPEDKLDSIFDRFGQVDKSMNKNRFGTGIGLALVKSFVNLHEGNISIKSKINEGSEFIVGISKDLESKEDVKEEHNKYETNVERINLEFSDIYDNELN
ncbi:MAG: ATP-binding protein [Clostridiaceae bacterium]